MDQDREIKDLEQLLDRMEMGAKETERVSFGDIMELVGRRSFGPLLLVAGLITLSPLIGDIPGVPTIMGIFVLLIAGQLLFRRKHLWLPQWLLKRSVAQHKFCKALKWLRPPALFIDRFLRPRLTFLTRSTGIYTIAIVCVLIAIAMPPMEMVPFSANGAGAVLTAFGLSLIAHDGLLALLGFCFTAVIFALAIIGIM